MSYYQNSNISRTTVTASTILSEAIFFGRFIFQIYKDIKDTITTGFEMTNVVTTGGVSSLFVMEAAVVHQKNKWVFS